MSDINTAFDYQLSQDATNVIGSVLVEGDNIIMETELEWNGNEATSTFIPSWTTAEEAAFIAGIKGKIVAPQTVRGYAKYPSKIGDTDHANYTEIADGLGGRPLARGSTMDAVKLLRQFFPRVFRAFWIKTENLSTAVKEGVDNKLEGLTLLDAPRPPLPRQMQYALIPALRDTTPSHKARDYLPVRVQVKSSTGLVRDFHDVTNINGLRVLGNGEIFLDGLAEELDGSDDIDKIYEGRLTSGPSINAAVLEVKLKLIKINIAFFERYDAPGIRAYHQLVREAIQAGLIVIGDVKRADIGHSATQYAYAQLGTITDPRLGEVVTPDAVTVNPYFGYDGIRPFVELARDTGGGLFVLVQTSNESAAEIQGLTLSDGTLLCERVAEIVQGWASDESLIGKSGYSCIGAVVSPRDLESTRRIRTLMPNCIFLVPGFGAQGRTKEEVAHCFKPDGTGALVTASRSVIYAFHEETYKDKCGDDWVRAVEIACRDLVQAVRSAIGN
ncbi:MAG: orotidine-5'-phosphate decarboxylase [Planctomycetes bacterium]|nr:orotidine-5'-phosphate decarboxylase [Planctomycetota bacterium]